MTVELNISEDGEVIELSFIEDDGTTMSTQLVISDCSDLIFALSDCMMKANEIRDGLKLARSKFN